MEKPKRKLKRNTAKITYFRVVSILFGLMCVVGTLVYTVLSTRTSGEGSFERVYVGEEARSQAESAFGFLISSQASNIQYYAMQLPRIDWVRYLYLEIPPYSDIDWTTKGTCFDELLPNATLQFMSSVEQIAGWSPNTATNYVSAFCGNNPYYQIMIDISDINTWIVYLVAYME
ncbi:MAG: hypothetical protein KC615_18490 [Anaerolineae bacterium]|nr:hypothetical protein [Anaerolineae bacterium]